MKYIAKSEEPKPFSEWKALENEHWKPSYSALSGDVKKAVYTSLLNEQGHICCYCERELIEGDYHIEHLNPQKNNDGDDLDYGNFLCSCLDQTAKGDPLHCGKLKGDREIDIHPLQDDCSRSFSFTADGEVIGESEAASKTIKILGLNIKKLGDLRRNAIEPFLSDEIDENFVQFVNKYLELSSSKKFNPFHSVIESLFARSRR